MHFAHLMDFQNRAGSKPGSGGVASFSQTNVDRRERLRKLALETIDLTKDPYFMKNHLGSYECKLCLTLHSNEGSYLAHTQGKKHQANLARRAAKDAVTHVGMPTIPSSNVPVAPQVMVPVPIRRNMVKIGRPGYKIIKIRDPDSRQLGLLFQLQYPDILGKETIPRYRFMSAYEQRLEPPDRYYQYLLIAAEPYETVGFKIQSREIDKSDGRFFTHWDPDGKQYSLQFFFKEAPSNPLRESSLPPPIVAPNLVTTTTSHNG